MLAGNHPLLSRLPAYSTLTVPSRYDLIGVESLERLVNVKSDAGGKALQQGEIDRLNGYLAYVQASSRGVATATHLRGFIKADRISAYLGRLVTNALKPDVHFLPKDGKPDSYSAIPVHSVVQFRYPLSIPIAALAAAESMLACQWTEHTISNSTKIPILRHMPAWPIKLAALQGEFLSDMVARYLSMYIRLGSSDFTEQSVLDMSREIGAK